MTLARYEILRTVVETGGFLKAAEEIGLTQSAVSHAIAGLEKEFGFPLLTRNRSGIMLTSNGEHILKHIRRVLNDNEQMLQEVAKIKGIEMGVVRIGTLPSTSINWLPQIMKQFKEKFPNITIKLLEGDYDNIHQWIINGSVDFGFLSLPADNTFDVIPLKKDKIRCIVSNQHKLSNRKVISMEQLKNELLIMPKLGADKDVRRLLKQNNITPNINYEFQEDQAIIAMVQNNLGISILPELILYRMPHNIKVIDLEGDHYRTLGIAALSFQNISPATTQFIEHMKKWL